MKRTLCAALAAMVSAALPAGAQIVFSENFDDGAAASRWTAPFYDSEDASADGNVFYAFDYVGLGLPLAPGGGSGLGAFFEVNLVDAGPIDEGVAVAIMPLAGLLPSGSFKLSMDAYLNVETANGGTTEYATFGVHNYPANQPGNPALTDDAPLSFGLSNGTGLAWQIDGDAGSTTDIYRYEDPNNANTGGSQTSLGPFDSLPAGAIPGLPANATGPNAIGPSNNWIKIEIERIDQTVTFSINGYVIDTVIDSADLFTGGTIMIGYADPFNSVAPPNLLVGPDPTPFDPTDGPFGDAYANTAHFLVVDNIVVEAIIPEPTAAMLCLGALSGLTMRRR